MHQSLVRFAKVLSQISGYKSDRCWPSAGNQIAPLTIKIDCWLSRLGYADNSGNQTLDVTDLGQVPEPITLSLFGADLAGAFAIRRKAKLV